MGENLSVTADTDYVYVLIDSPLLPFLLFLQYSDPVVSTGLRGEVAL